jgi:hypothetical protein
MPDWLAELSKNRRNWVTSTRLNNFEAGIRGSTVDKYADPAHFVFELLQNAEDQEATHVRFRLEADRLVFTHNGDAFTRDDVVSITGIGNSDKPAQANKIGRFGIGFKSVFAVSNRPEVYTCLSGKPFAFAIEDLVVPVPLELVHDIPASETRFVFPLKEGDRDNIRQTIRERLSTLGAHTLLFLNHIEAVDWESDLASGSYTCDRSDSSIRVLRNLPAGGEGVQRRSRYLLYSRDVNIQDADRPLTVRIAFRFNDQGQVVPEDQGTKLFVYFETEERTGLRFLVHGPFLLTDNRANTKQKNRKNAALTAECTRLLLDALHDLKERSLLGATALAALPNDDDNLPEFSQSIREAVVAAVKEHALIPAEDGGHASATKLVRGAAAVRELLDDSALAFLSENAYVGWAVNVARNPRAEQFLRTAGVGEWGLKQLAEAVGERFGGYHSRVEGQAWLAGSKDTWLQHFYALLRKAVSESETAAWELRQWRIVRVEDGTHTAGPGVYFPPEKGKGTLDLPRIKAGVLTGANQSRRDNAKKLLTELGVQEIGEREEIEGIIKKHYSTDGTAPSPATHLRHIRRFVEWWNRHQETDVFQDACLFLDAVGQSRQVPDDCYLDEPFCTSGLRLICGGSIKGLKKHALWQGYNELSCKGFVKFATALGVHARLEVAKVGIHQSHPNYNELLKDYFRSGTRWTDSAISEDYVLPSCSSLLAARDSEISRLIWRTMSHVSAEVLQAKFRPNRSYDIRTAPSSVVIALRDTAWVPDKTGELRRPRDMTRALLAAGFPFPTQTEWLFAIGFGDGERQRSESYQQRVEMAKELGLPVELLDRLDDLDEATRQSVIEQFSDLLDREQLPEFPKRRSSNPERRAAKLRERLVKSPAKTRDVRDRTVRPSEAASRSDARTYLKDFYTNKDGVMVCQACHRPMPFRLASGDYYFEAVELFEDLVHEYRENYLALCPVCAAMFRHASDVEPDEFRESLQEASDLTVEVTLAGQAYRIRFVDDHRIDLLALADVDSQESSEADVAIGTAANC